MSTIYEVCVEECDFEKLERGRYQISVVERGFDHEGNRFSVWHGGSVWLGDKG